MILPQYPNLIVRLSSRFAINYFTTEMKILSPGDQVSLKSPSLLANILPADARNLAELIAALKIPKDWDAIAFTDGSGTKPDKPGGYAVAVLFRLCPDITLSAGHLSGCSSQHAEVRAVYELANLLQQYGAGKKRGGFRCHLVTDSKYVFGRLGQIAKDPAAAFKAKNHTLQWIGIQYVSRFGVIIHPHHLPRNSNPLMQLVDDSSRRARLSSFDVDAAADACLVQCQKEFSLTDPLSLQS